MITKPEIKNNNLIYLLGAACIILNYIKHGVFGYRKARPFSTREIDKTIRYDINVVKGWIKYLKKNKTQNNPINNKVILELGPGPDLGTGIVLLGMGAKKYIALDVCPLAEEAPKELYDQLLYVLEKEYPHSDINFLREQVDKFYSGKPSCISYIVDNDFNITKVNDKIDIVVSQAAFEYFSDAEKTFRELSTVVNNNAVIVSEIDLRTHTTVIRDKDPLNIYRFSDTFWNFFKSRYNLNRIRAFEYKELLVKSGWYDVEIEPLAVLAEKYVKKVKPFLNTRFSKMDVSEMKLLSIMLRAKKN